MTAVGICGYVSVLGLRSLFGSEYLVAAVCTSMTSIRFRSKFRFKCMLEISEHYDSNVCEVQLDLTTLTWHWVGTTGYI